MQSDSFDEAEVGGDERLTRARESARASARASVRPAPAAASLRAGLRIARPAQEPPPFFAAVEMAVLVLVTALAMVSIIVSADADASERPTTVASASPHGGAARSVAER